jgi:hypothetical protein
MFLLFISIYVLSYILKSIIIKYPEIVIDGLSIFKILTYPFKNKVNKVHEHIETIDKKYEEYENKYDDLIYNLLYPFPQTLLYSFIFGYIYYIIMDQLIDSSILSLIFNISSIIITYKYLKNKKIKENKNEK